MDIRTPAFQRLLEIWLDEDLGRGDLSANALQAEAKSAYWVAKEAGVFCGGIFAEAIFKRLDNEVNVKHLIKDGEKFDQNQKLLEIHGPGKALVAGERIALNIAMHLSGVATTTHLLASELKGSGVHLADTRKTTPGLRMLEKYAVKCGGGINHRLGLDDAAMLKENHIAWAENIDQAVLAIKESAPWPARIIVEAETAEQAEQAIKAGADGILLDEMSPALLHSLVPRLRALARTRVEITGANTVVIEASGVSPVHLKDYAKTGVDLISTSAPITKSSWIDLSMRFL